MIICGVDRLATHCSETKGEPLLFSLAKSVFEYHHIFKDVLRKTEQLSFLEILS
jgi:hypothetical protein